MNLFFWHASGQKGEEPTMKLIVGLGNPGTKYAGTRHNAGFSALVALADEWNISLNKKEGKSITGHGVVAGEKCVLAMPQTYMNLSGEAVQQLMNFYRLTPAELIVFCDDVALDVGRIRIREKGSAGGHNGLKNIIQCTGTEDFIRIRVGVGKKPEDYDMVDYVLGHFPKEELPQMRDACDRAAAAAKTIIESGVGEAQNRFNGV